MSAVAWPWISWAFDKRASMRGTVALLTFISIWKDVGRISILEPPISVFVGGGPSHTLAYQSPPPPHIHTEHICNSQTLEKDQC